MPPAESLDSTRIDYRSGTGIGGRGDERDVRTEEGCGFAAAVRDLPRGTSSTDSR
jgi:hypothetical protein